jgi:hypothetical protein
MLGLVTASKGSGYDETGFPAHRAIAPRPPDHGARHMAGWRGRGAILIPSPMPALVLAFPVPGGYAVGYNSRRAEGGKAPCASTGAVGYGERS